MIKHADQALYQAKEMGRDGVILDDEEMIKDTACQMLDCLGYEVEFSKDGAEAIELYYKGKRIRLAL